MSANTSIERRTLSASDLSSGDPKTLEGYAARYASVTNIGEFFEVIAPGAFRSAIQRGDDIRLLVDHNPSSILARTKSGTMKVTEDTIGLYFSARVANTQIGRDTLELVQRRDLSGCSFGFVVGSGNDDWTTETDSNGNSYILRTIRDFKEVSDCSVCTYPAYASTTVAARAAAVIPDRVLTEARSFAQRAGIVAPHKLGYVPVVPMTDEEIANAVEEEKGIRARTLGMSPTVVDRFIARHK